MNMGLELDVVDLVFVVINFVMMFLIFLCFFLLLRFLWRAGRKQPKAGAGENTAYNKEEIGEDDMTASSTAAAAGVSLGKVLRRHRLACGMTQEFVAEQLGVSRQSVSKWEQGLARPSTGNIQGLAELFGVAARDLLRDSQK